MSSVPGEALFGRKRSVASGSWAGHCHLEDPAGQGGRLLAYVRASGTSAGQPSLGLNEKALNL